MGRYQTLKSSIKTINVNPALSWKISPRSHRGRRQLPDHRGHADAKRPTIRPARWRPAPPAGPASRGADPSIIARRPRTRREGHDHRRRRRLGLERRCRVRPDAAPRMAAAYRSAIKYDVNGNVEYTNPTTALAPGTPPQLAGTIAALSAAINQTYTYNRGVGSTSRCRRSPTCRCTGKSTEWDLMADAQYTGWSSIPEPEFVASAPPTCPRCRGVGRHLEDRRRRQLPVQRPMEIPCRHRIRPDAGDDPSHAAAARLRPLVVCDRRRVQATPNWKFDAGFVYIKGDSAEFNQQFGTGTNSIVPGQLRGSYDASVTIFSVQAAYTF